MNPAIEQLENDTVAVLEEKMKNDNIFRLKYASLVEFYTKKIMNLVNKDSLEPLAEEFENVFQAQYFKGYHVMRVLLEDEFFTEDTSVWSWLEGETTIRLPLLLEEVLTQIDSTDWDYTDIGYTYSIKILKEINNAYDLIKLARKEIAYLGAIQAFLDDSRYKGGESIDNDMTSHFGRLDDVHFLNPEIYMTISHFEEGKEVWDVRAWGPFNNDEWMGNVEFHHYSMPEGTLYGMNLMLSYLIREDERYSIIGMLHDKLPGEIQQALQIKNYTCSDMETLHK